jgi:hypothetical protein
MSTRMHLIWYQGQKRFFMFLLMLESGLIFNQYFSIVSKTESKSYKTPVLDRLKNPQESIGTKYKRRKQAIKTCAKYGTFRY